MSTLIIAEAGVNHDGSIERAVELVRVAASAGADLVKFQTFKADELVLPTARKAEYQEARTADESQHAMVRRLELSESDHHRLIVECERAGIGFFSTGFDPASIDMLVSMGADRLKVPSGEITNLPFLRHVASKRLPVILSTGMAYLAEVEEALAALEQAGLPRSQVTVLHCTTAYPTPMAEVNLSAMVRMGQSLGVAYGYSDHTLGIEVPIAAVALGATVIEKHLTLDRSSPGPDHAASLEPDELTAMVKAIRNIELAMAGDGLKKPAPSEIPNIPVARKSLVARREISPGEKYSEANVTAKRPGTGLSPMKWDEVIGRSAPRAFMPDELIEL